MQMRKLVLISAVFLILLTSPVFAKADLDVEVDLPEGSVIPGETVTLTIAMENTGDTAAGGVSYEVITGTELTGYSTGLVFVDSVPSGITKRYNIPLTVSSTASDGTYAVTVKVRYSGGTDSPITESKTLRVGSQDSFYISDIYYEKNALEPGTDREVSIALKNVGGQKLNNIFAELLPNTSDIIPYGSGAEAYLESLSPGSIKILDFKVSIDSEAETKTYSTNLNIDYESVSGKKLSETISIGLPVSGTPKLEILNYEIDDDTFEVEIENLGTARAKAIRVELIQDGETIGVDVDNELRIDKHTTFRFETYKKGIGELKITFLDGQNKEYTKSVSVQIDKSSGGLGISPSMFVLFLIVIAEAVFILKLKEIGPFEEKKK
ncbi:MAG: CARDB domain-containing protein [Candidatus Undinarchaeales archaeon]